MKANRASRDPARSKAFWQACEALEKNGIRSQDIQVSRGRVWKLNGDEEATCMAEIRGTEIVWTSAAPEGIGL
eukprot:7910801-Karenia_brevis.AAC.1